MLWGFFLPMPDPQTVFEGYFYVEVPLCSLCGCFFFKFNLILLYFLLHFTSLHFFTLLPQCMLAITPLIGGVSDVVVTRACTGY